MKTLIIVPAYNESESLGKVVNNLNTECPGTDYVIINDGSSDDTVSLCEKNGWNYLNLPVNLGLAGAFQTGMKFGYENGYDAVLQFDGDGQHDAACAKKLIARMEETNCDILIGSRFVECKKPSTMRMFGSRLISFAINLTTGKKLSDPTSGMRLYNKDMVDMYANNLNFGPEPDTIAYLIRNGANVEEIQVVMHEREAGQSYLTTMKSMRYMVNMFISILLVQFFRKKRASK